MPHLGILLFAAITVSPAGASVPPRASRAFSATGGKAPYTFAFASNASGASLAGGLYQAGPRGNVQDVLRVTDATGDAKTVSIQVGPGVTVAPSGARVPPRGAYVFAATGGDGRGYAWTVDGAGSIDSGGRYVAGPSGGATVRATDSLGNTASATVTIGPGVLLDPVDVMVDPGESVTFAATGGSGAYVFALEEAPSGGAIDPASGVYTAGPTGNVDDVIALSDDLGNVTTGTIHVRANPAPSGTSPAPSTGSSDEPASEPGSVPKHSVNLAGGGAADNACDCGVVGVSTRRADGRSDGLPLGALAIGLVLFARRRRID